MGKILDRNMYGHCDSIALNLFSNVASFNLESFFKNPIILLKEKNSYRKELKNLIHKMIHESEKTENIFFWFHHTN
jgi:hypothetical protein